MKGRILLLALLSITCLYAQPQSHQDASSMPQQQAQGRLQWYEDYDRAQQVAAQENKPMLLYFTGSDWCGWCKKMDSEVFSSPAFAQDVGNKFVFVKVDFPMNSKLPEAQMRQNAQLKQRYGVTGYPTVVIVDKQGGFIGETGYRSGGGKAYAEWLEQFLTQ